MKSNLKHLAYFFFLAFSTLLCLFLYAGKSIDGFSWIFWIAWIAWVLLVNIIDLRIQRINFEWFLPGLLLAIYGISRQTFLMETDWIGFYLGIILSFLILDSFSNFMNWAMHKRLSSQGSNSLVVGGVLIILSLALSMIITLNYLIMLAAVILILSLFYWVSQKRELKIHYLASFLIFFILLIFTLMQKTLLPYILFGLAICFIVLELILPMISRWQASPESDSNGAMPVILGGADPVYLAIISALGGIHFGIVSLLFGLVSLVLYSLSARVLRVETPRSVPFLPFITLGMLFLLALIAQNK